MKRDNKIYMSDSCVFQHSEQRLENLAHLRYMLAHNSVFAPHTDFQIRALQFQQRTRLNLILNISSFQQAPTAHTNCQQKWWGEDGRSWCMQHCHFPEMGNFVLREGNLWQMPGGCPCPAAGCKGHKRGHTLMAWLIKCNCMLPLKGKGFFHHLPIALQLHNLAQCPNETHTPAPNNNFPLNRPAGLPQAAMAGSAARGASGLGKGRLILSVLTYCFQQQQFSLCARLFKPGKEVS